MTALERAARKVLEGCPSNLAEVWQGVGVVAVPIESLIALQKALEGTAHVQYATPVEARGRDRQSLWHGGEVTAPEYPS